MEWLTSFDGDDLPAVFSASCNSSSGTSSRRMIGTTSSRPSPKRSPRSSTRSAPRPRRWLRLPQPRDRHADPQPRQEPRGGAPTLRARAARTRHSFTWSEFMSIEEALRARPRRQPARRHDRQRPAHPRRQRPGGRREELVDGYLSRPDEEAAPHHSPASTSPAARPGSSCPAATKPSATCSNTPSQPQTTRPHRPRAKKRSSRCCGCSRTTGQRGQARPTGALPRTLVQDEQSSAPRLVEQHDWDHPTRRASSSAG